jgi:Fur family peroxide stress response transcriptional regulator
MMSIGKKHSRQRDEILAVLKETPVHPGARWVHERLRDKMPQLSLATVYRNLTLFRNEGHAMTVGVVNGEERFDAITDPHPHIVCTSCGKVADLPVPSDEALKRVAGELSGTLVGFGIDYRRALFCGTCSDCAANEAKGAVAS